MATAIKAIGDPEVKCIDSEVNDFACVEMGHHVFFFPVIWFFFCPGRYTLTKCDIRRGCISLRGRRKKGKGRGEGGGRKGKGKGAPALRAYVFA